eukprot:NODE_62_length_26495_cov_0.832853.p11 type:complete len:313 gc:universal NODE_62_length_26495_cov_0.832853:23922-22984(-)
MLVIAADVPDIEYDGKFVKCSPKDVQKHLKDAEYILCTINANLQNLKEAKKLKMISTISVGVDHINVPYCQENNIKIGYTPDILSDAVADICIGLVLMVMRKMVIGINAAKQGNLVHDFSLFNGIVGTDIKNKTVGIIGMGRIGFEIAKRIAAFDVDKILYTGTSGPKPIQDYNVNHKVVSFIYVPLEELLKSSDVVILSSALNKQTEKMVNLKFFKSMKPNSFFFNISRGKLVDTDALVEALEKKIIAGAGLDVVDPEPLPTNHKLFKLENCVLLPHIGSAGIETRENMFKLAVENLRQFKSNGTLLCEYK